jgi:hypothetical protein
LARLDGWNIYTLSDPERLYWGGWSGRFSRTKHKNVWSRHAPEKADEQKYGDFHMFEADSEEEEWTDHVHDETFNSFMVPVCRFRRAMFNDFRARMDWCVQEFSEANHNPAAAVNGDKGDDIIHLQVSPGQKLTLDASASSDRRTGHQIVVWCPWHRSRLLRVCMMADAILMGRHHSCYWSLGGYVEVFGQRPQDLYNPTGPAHPDFLPACPVSLSCSHALRGNGLL